MIRRNFRDKQEVIFSDGGANVFANVACAFVGANKPLRVHNAAVFRVLADSGKERVGVLPVVGNGVYLHPVSPPFGEIIPLGAITETEEERNKKSA